MAALFTPCAEPCVWVSCDARGQPRDTVPTYSDALSKLPRVTDTSDTHVLTQDARTGTLVVYARTPAFAACKLHECALFDDKPFIRAVRVDVEARALNAWHTWALKHLEDACQHPQRTAAQVTNATLLKARAQAERVLEHALDHANASARALLRNVRADEAATFLSTACNLFACTVHACVQEAGARMLRVTLDTSLEPLAPWSVPDDALYARTAPRAWWQAWMRACASRGTVLEWSERARVRCANARVCELTRVWLAMSAAGDAAASASGAATEALVANTRVATADEADRTTASANGGARAAVRESMKLDAGTSYRASAWRDDDGRELDADDPPPTVLGTLAVYSTDAAPAFTHVAAPLGALLAAEWLRALPALADV